MDALVLTWCCTITPTITEEVSCLSPSINAYLSRHLPSFLMQEYATCCNAMAEAWPGNPTVQRLKDLPPTFDTLREPKFPL